MLFDQFSEPESFVEFAHQDQAAGGSDAGILEIDLDSFLRSVYTGVFEELVPERRQDSKREAPEGKVCHEGTKGRDSDL